MHRQGAPPEQVDAVEPCRYRQMALWLRGADTTRAVGLVGIGHAAVSGCLQRAKGACPFLDDIFASHVVRFSARIKIVCTEMKCTRLLLLHIQPEESLVLAREKLRSMIELISAFPPPCHASTRSSASFKHSASGAHFFQRFRAESTCHT